MPLEPYRRGGVWWAKGRIEYNGRPITGYRRASTGATSEAGCRDWIVAETERAIRRHLIGEEAAELTFAGACAFYDANPTTIDYLAKLLPHIARAPVSSINGNYLKALATEIYPHASTDTWRRQVITPVCAVINSAHQSGKCAPIRVQGFSDKERAAQDIRRGKTSRRERRASSREWVAAFVSHADPYNAALVEFMFETAARIGQAVEIRPEDVNLQDRQVRMPASKGFPETDVAISTGMMVRLANLPPRRPFNRKTGEYGDPRVFGYADRGGMRKAWVTICRKAGIPYLSPHEAGRHGFYTELRVRQGVDPHSAAAAGRWKSAAVPERIYAHTDADEREMRERIRTGRVQPPSDGDAKILSIMGKPEED